MKKFIFSSIIFILTLVSSTLPIAALAATAANKTPEPEGWTILPAGARPAYMGIHGGTMPVSLLVGGDGASLFAFVGQTGNDFLEALSKVYKPLPSFGNSTRQESRQPPVIHSDLFAGNATASLPVVALSGDRLAKESWLEHMQPFGLSPKPLSIEGQVSKPEISTSAKKYRIFFLPDYFQPQRAKN